MIACYRRWNEQLPLFCLSRKLCRNAHQPKVGAQQCRRVVESHRVSASSLIEGPARHSDWGSHRKLKKKKDFAQTKK